VRAFAGREKKRSHLRFVSCFFLNPCPALLSTVCANDNRFRIIRRIGGGSFGEIYMGIGPNLIEVRWCVCVNVVVALGLHGTARSWHGIPLRSPRSISLLVQRSP